MINIVSVGPPQSGTTDLRSTKVDSGDDQVKATANFAETLKERTSEKAIQVGKNKSVAERDGPRRENAEGEIKEKSPSLGITTKKTQLAREKAIQKFMDSFESEFGIPPTRIVEAMAQLKTEGLQKPAEETAEVFVSKLGLDEENQGKAKEMYLGFMFNLQAIEQTPRAPLAVPVNPENLMKAQMNERYMVNQGKKDILRNSLSTLNDKFWMKAPAVPVSAPIGPSTEIVPEQKAITIGDLMREQEASANASTAMNSFDVQGVDLSQEIKFLENEVDPKLLKEMSPSDLQNLIRELRSLREQNQRNSALGYSKEAALGAGAVIANRSLVDSNKIVTNELPMKSNDMQSENFAAGLSSAQLGAKSVEPEIIPNANSITNGAAEMVKGTKEFFPSNRSMMNNSQQQFSQGQDNLKTASPISKKKSDLSVDEATYSAGLGITANKSLNAEVQNLHGENLNLAVSPKEKQENIQQIMNQAQYLIKKGGGEMKVKLSPEGLGDMHLKVMVENGKVNLQMSAETNEAKKLFESSVSDLKQSLSAHRLSVDSVKIDVVSSTSSDVSTRQDSNSMNSQNQFQGQRETRQFWNQFQEQFGSRAQRDNFFDVPNLKGYGQKKRDPLTPLTEAQRPQRADGRGSAIDVVA